MKIKFKITENEKILKMVTLNAFFEKSTISSDSIYNEKGVKLHLKVPQKGVNRTKR